MKLSNTKAGTFRRCPKKYEFGYVMGLKAKRKALPLERGSWLHTLLEVHFAQDPKKVVEVKGRKVRVGKDWRKAHRAYTKWFYTLFEEERDELGHDLPDEVERIMRGYLSRYKEESEDERTVAVELDEWVELPNGDTFNFIIDRVFVKSDGGVWLRDYKTVSSFMDSDFMLIDAQLARYFWAFQRIPRFRKLARRLQGVEFDELRTKAPTIPELVQAKGHTKKNPKPKVLTKRANLDTDYRTYLKAIKDNGLDPKDYRDVLVRLKADDERFYRRTVMPRDNPIVRQMMVDLLDTSKDIKRAERRGRFPRTPDKSCKWMCEFLEPCIADLHGLDIGDIVELKFDVKERSAS